MHLMRDINVHLENRKLSRAFFIFVWVMYAAVYMTKNCFSGALAAIVDEGAMTLTQTSWISAAFYIAYTPLQILGGVFADKYSPERLITVGLVGSAAANVAIFFNQNYYFILCAWVFNAIIQFSLWPAVFKIVSSQLVRSDRSQMIFFLSFSSSGGLVLTYAVSAIIPKWQYNFLVSAAVLVACTVVMQVFCHKLDPILKKDRDVPQAPRAAQVCDAHKISTAKLFLMSGFFAVLPAVLLRTMVENGTKSMSPTMLMQSYADISPSTGNLLNILIILAGIVGTLITKALIYPRIIKNEIVGTFILFALALPFAFVLRSVGEMPLWLVIISLCAISTVLTSTHLLTQYFNMNYVKYGKNGTAAGLLNCAASFGLVLQFCVFGPVAENFGWNVIADIWVWMMIVAIVFVAFAIRPSVRFEKKLEEEKRSEGK